MIWFCKTLYLLTSWLGIQVYGLGVCYFKYAVNSNGEGENACTAETGIYSGDLVFIHDV